MAETCIDVKGFTKKNGVKVKAHKRCYDLREQSADESSKFKSFISKFPNLKNTNDESRGKIKDGASTSEDGKARRGSRLFSEPFSKASEISARYREENGIGIDDLVFDKGEDGSNKFTLDKERSKVIADAFDSMEHDPTNPEVKDAYNALINETIEQYKYLQDAGIGIEMSVDGASAYKSSTDFIEDLENNNHLYIFPTESGFGSSENGIEDNPLLKETEFKDINGKPMLANDLFRAVHDFFGHAVYGNSTGPKGEEIGWNHHSRMFSPLARRALTTETRGQNSWVNFSGANDMAKAKISLGNKLIKEGDIENGERLKKEGQEGFKFADQKIGLLPIEFSKLDDEDEFPTTQEPFQAADEVVVNILNGFIGSNGLSEAIENISEVEGLTPKEVEKILKDSGII